MRKTFQLAAARDDFEGCFKLYKEKNIYNFYMLVDSGDDKTGGASGTTTHELCPHEVAAGGGLQPGFPRQGFRP